MNFPDVSHLERLRESLWSNSEIGRASVLIGAGFSRNAKPLSHSSSQFPLWADLMNAMARDLKLDNDLQSCKNPLRLASQYEAAFGRPALDALLLRFVPDDQHEPDEAHHLLLSLPWADIFTTNYDTLLERTRSLTNVRHYDVVLSPEDLPRSRRPRIVKLHGSMPSSRPFIITEEDYRRYPQESAPFVNSVQQSAMETTLCLIGFGGEDPNFLQWAGWVHDHLGRHSPPIFIIGVLDFLESERALLTSRRVTPIDLGPLFPRDQWQHNPQARHTEATLWLLRSLHHGRPIDLCQWPIVRAPPLWPDPPNGPRLMPRPSPSQTPRNPPSFEDLEGTITVEKALEVIHFWKEQRLSYPGWLVCPESNRKVLAQRPWWSIKELLVAIAEMPLPEQLNALFEIIWHFETCLFPLFNDYAKAVADVLERVNPFSDRLNDLDCKTPLSPISHRDLHVDWTELADHWVHLAFSLLRDARRTFNQGSFEKWRLRLAKIAHLNSQWQQHLHHETCLSHLFTLKRSSLKAALEEWSSAPPNSSPIWAGRMSALYAELGDFETARHLASAALEQVRTTPDTKGPNYLLLSSEGWLMSLQDILGSAEWSKRPGASDPTFDPKQRLSTLGASFRCNPLLDREARRVELLKPIPARRETKIGFDPGTSSTTNHISMSFDDAPWALTSMLEEGYWPLRAGMCSVLGKEVAQAASRLSQVCPEYALSLFVRSHSIDGLEKWLSRARVALMEEQTVAALFRLLYSGIQDASSNDSCGWLTVSIEAISRLTPRLNATQLHDTFELACNLFRLPAASTDRTTTRRIDTLFRRLLFSMPCDDLAWSASMMLKLPIPERGRFERIDPFIHFEARRARTPLEFDQGEWKKIVAELLIRAESSNSSIRSNALLRLVSLFEIGSLGEEAASALGKALWEKVDEKGLPADMPFHQHYFLVLPEPKPGMAQAHLRKHFLEQAFPPLPEDDSPFSTQHLSRVHEHFIDLHLCGRLPWQSTEVAAQRIDWSAQDALELLRITHSWWTTSRSRFDEIPAWNNEFGELSKSVVRQCLRVLLGTIATRLPESASEALKSAAQLVSDLSAIDSSAAATAPYGLLFIGKSVDEVVRIARTAIHSSSYDEAANAAHGIVDWHLWSQTGTIAPPPLELVGELVFRSVFRRDAALASSLAAVTTLVRLAPNALQVSHVDILELGLERLLDDTRLDADLADGILEMDKRPDCRAASASLARGLGLWRESRGMTLPKVLNSWREACSHDSLPEVRQAWEA